MHIKIYIHAKKEAGLLPDGFEETVDKVAADASRALIGKGRISGNREAVIELNLMSNLQIAEVNKHLRGKEGPTDVISLRLSNPEDVGKACMPKPCVGEVYISLEKCALQAEEIGQSFLEELAFLTVHGILHIFDYDHQTSAEEREMMSFANEILGRV